MKKSKSPISCPPTRVGLFAQLPAATVKEIKRRSKAEGIAQWQVIAAAFSARK